jgi:hypothetical protein
MKLTAGARDEGTPIEQVRAIIRRNFHQTGVSTEMTTVMENMVREVYLKEESPLTVGRTTYARCLAVMHDSDE